MPIPSPIPRAMDSVNDFNVSIFPLGNGKALVVVGILARVVDGKARYVVRVVILDLNDAVFDLGSFKLVVTIDEVVLASTNKLSRYPRTEINGVCYSVSPDKTCMIADHQRSPRLCTKARYHLGFGISSW
jgi:hypothetical protein